MERQVVTGAMLARRCLLLGAIAVGVCAAVWFAAVYNSYFDWGSAFVQTPLAIVSALVCLSLVDRASRIDRFAGSLGVLCIFAAASTDIVGSRDLIRSFWVAWGMDLFRVVGFVCVLYCGLKPAWSKGRAARGLAIVTGAAVLIGVIAGMPSALAFMRAPNLQSVPRWRIENGAWAVGAGGILSVFAISATSPQRRRFEPKGLRAIIGDHSVHCPVCAGPSRPLGAARFACTACDAEFTLQARLTKCPTCRYSLENIDVHVCPECGAHVRIPPTACGVA